MTEGFLNCAEHDVDTCGFILVGTAETFGILDCADIGYTATGNDTFGYCCTGCAESVVNAVLLLLHLNFGGCADMEHCHTACQFGKAFLEFLTVVVALCLFDLRLDLCNTCCDGVLVACPVNDGGGFLVHGYLFSSSEHIE